MLDRPGRCTFPTRGPSRYFGGDAKLAGQLRTVIREALGAGADVRVGIADSTFTAGLAARRAPPEEALVIAPGASPEFLAPWPVSVFEDPELAHLLVRLGLRTLGDVAALPPDALLARFGVEGRAFHELARGLDPGPPVLVTPPPDLVEQVELDPPATRVDVAAFAAKGLADRLLARLDERGLACTRVVVEAETEHGERLARCWRHEGALSPATLAERVRWQLDGWLTQAQPVARPSRVLSRATRVRNRISPRSRKPGSTPPPARSRWCDSSPTRSFPRTAANSGSGVATRSRATAPTARSPRARDVGLRRGRDRRRARRSHSRRTGALGAVGRAARVRTRRHRRRDARLARRGARPYPARVFVPPLPAALLDDRGRPVVVTGRGDHSAPPARLECRLLPAGGGAVQSWAGPWAHDLRWWDPPRAAVVSSGTS